MLKIVTGSGAVWCAVRCTMCTMEKKPCRRRLDLTRVAYLRHKLGGADVAGHEPAGAPADGALRPVLLPRQLVALHMPDTQHHSGSTRRTGKVTASICSRSAGSNLHRPLVHDLRPLTACMTPTSQLAWELELQGLPSYRAECHDMYACAYQLMALLGMGAPAGTPAGPRPAARSRWRLSAMSSSGLPHILCLQCR